MLNPDGVAANQRYNFRNVDLNRNWPAENRRERSTRSGTSALSEPETAALAKLIDDLRPARILSLHQAAECIDWNGPAEKLAKAMAAVCDLPAKRLGGRPGSMGSYLGTDRGIPIITFEFPPAAYAMSETTKWTHYGEAMKVFIRGG